MITGIKKQEFRKPSKWIKSRLLDKKHKYIKFVNGYGKDKPYFICLYKGYSQSKKSQILYFENQKIEIENNDYIINLGKIIDYGNLDSLGPEKLLLKNISPLLNN